MYTWKRVIWKCDCYYNKSQHNQSEYFISNFINACILYESNTYNLFHAIVLCGED